MNILTTKTSNSTAVTDQLLKQFRIKANRSTISMLLESHPAYPSLLAISDCLTTLKVKHKIYRLNKKKYSSSNLSFPFITQLAKGGGVFVLVKNIIGGQVNIADEQNKNQFLSEREFINLWGGIVLYAQPNEKSGEQNYQQHRIQSVLQQITLPLFFTVLLSTIIIILNSFTIHYATLLLCIIKLTGITVSILLLMNSINSDNQFIRNICGSGGKNDCNALLQSEAAKINPWLNWSEIGFFYFTGSFLVVLFFPVLTPVLSRMNLLTLPFIIYSLTYQYRMKKWCMLCCTVQGLLIMECFAFNFGLSKWNYHLGLNLHLVIPFLLCFLLPITTWALLRPILIKASLVKPLQQQLKKFKYNSGLFVNALKDQTHYDLSDNILPIILGSPGAKLKITVISNPFCRPCGETHHFIEEWLQQRNDLAAQFLFAHSDNDDDAHTKVVRHLMALNFLEDKYIVIRAMNDWYKQSNKRYETWAENYPVEITTAVKETCTNQKRWCDHIKITFTPTILVNGYKLPELYQLEDLKYLV